MRTKIIALMVIMAAQAHAQTLLSYTNVRADVSGGPAFSSSAVAGSFRFTYVVEDTPGVPLNLDDGTTFRLEAWAADGVRAHNVASTNLVSTDLSSGQVRFVVPSIGVGEYRIRGVAQPAGGDTTLVWQITHHMLTVTSAPSAGATYPVSLSLVPLLPSNGLIGTIAQPWGEINAQTARVEKLIAADLDVSGAITAIDTGRVSKLGDTMTGPLTNAHGYYGWAGALTGLNWSAISNAPTIPDLADVVTNRGATLNGQPISNGAAIVISHGNVGSVQLYTNAGGSIILTNSAGYEEPISLTRHVSTPTPTVRRSYDSQDTWSNLNAAASAWGWVSNGMAYATCSNIFASGRFFDYRSVTSGSWVRVSVRIVQLMHNGFSTGAGRNQGLAWRDYGGTNNFWGIYNSGVASFDVTESYIYNLSYSSAQDTRYVTPFQAGSLGIYFYLGTQNYYLFMDHDGTNKTRYYVGMSPDTPIPAYYATNVQPMQGVSMVINQTTTATGVATNLVNTPLIWDDLTIEEGKLWLAPFSHN